MVLQIGSSFWAGTFCFQATRQEVHMPSTAWIPQNTPEVAETHAQTETAPWNKKISRFFLKWHADV